ncbi:MAG: methylenetetrahydrofolate reductase [NAD(P)H] [Oscillospiraceae bacterium]|nr:methylenetetrahydrofolate reductase [NAD(P)H] [Oscillospiraceae bacterium]
MKISDLYGKKLVFSFEVFPPKRQSSTDTIYSTIDQLRNLNPDFISVTYGAAGSDNNIKTLEIASAVKNRYGIESAAHLPCINLTKEDVLSALDSYRENSIENILALRGDVPEGTTPWGDFKHADELIAFIREHGDFNVMAACYPEGHIESESMVKDIINLRRKVDAGCSSLITQLFFDNRYFYDFKERAAIAGINVPVEAGIMPVINKKQIERMTTLCGVQLPEKFVKMMARYENNSEAMRDAGIAYAVDQIVDLIANGVDGIHLYTMNNPYVAQKIYEAVYRLIAA